MFKTAYGTNNAASFLNSELVKKIQLAKAEGVLKPLEEGGTLLYVMLSDTRTKVIENFDHPVHITDSRGEYWVIDMRGYQSRLTISESGNIIKVPEHSPAEILVLRAKLEIYWNKFPPLEMMYFGDIPMVVFSRWMAQQIKSRCTTLSEMDMITLQALSAFYYYSLFIPKENWGKASVRGIATKINRILGTPIDKVENWLKDVPYTGDLASFANLIKSKIDNAGLQKIDDGYIINVTVNSWFGSNDSRAIINAALEFPPTFISLVLAAGRTSNYRKTILGERVEHEKNKWKFDTFNTLVTTALKNIK